MADYLTEAAKIPDAGSAAAKERLISEGRNKFAYATDLGRSFEEAWQIWDAVSSISVFRSNRGRLRSIMNSC